MPSLKDLRKRISSVKNTQQITKAMKMVAAAKLRRAQEAVEGSRPYAHKLDEVIDQLIGRLEDPRHPLLEKRDVEKLDLVIVASDRGLAGAYNGNVLRAADKLIAAERKRGKQVNLFCVGKRVRDYYRKRPATPIVDEYIDLVKTVSWGTAQLLADKMVERFTGGEADQTTMIFTRFKSAMTQVVTTRTMLPLAIEKVEEQAGIEHKYEPAREQLLDALLPRQLAIQVFQALMEAVASEHGARMTAMDSATNNASDMIEDLTMQANRARQGIITKELMEIVGGKEAMEQ